MLLVSKMQSEVWRFVALLGVAVFASSLILPILTVQFLGANVLSVSLLDLYAILGRNAPSSAQAIPSDLKSLGAGFFVALLAVLIFYPATVIAGFVAVFKSRKAACAAGSMGLVWWFASLYLVSALRWSAPGNVLAVQFGSTAYAAFIGSCLMLASYLLPHRLKTSETSKPSSAPSSAPLNA
jgi:hypothetical protein